MGVLWFSIYRKSTHTNRYLHYESHYPPQHRAVVVRTLYSRADKLLSDESIKQAEYTYISKVLNKNLYSKEFVRKHRPAATQIRINDVQSGDETVTGYATLPYVQAVTEKVKRVLTTKGIKTSVRPASTLRQLLSKKKDQIPADI